MEGGFYKTTGWYSPKNHDPPPHTSHTRHKGEDSGLRATREQINNNTEHQQLQNPSGPAMIYESCSHGVLTTQFLFSSLLNVLFPVFRAKGRPYGFDLHNVPMWRGAVP